jgi:hypothetical protein
MSRIAARLRPVAILCAVVAVLGAERLMDRGYPLPGPLTTGADLANYFYPAVVYMRSVFARGDIPLWNPHQLAGEPFLATHQPAVLYPPLVMWLWLPPLLALPAHALFHVLLAGLFTYGYARRIGLRSAAALGAGFAYMLSYAVLESVFNTAYLSSYVWLPAVLCGVHDVLLTPRGAGVFLLGVSVALGILSGQAQAFFYIAEIAAVYALAIVIVRRPRARGVAFAAAAATLGVCAASAQLAMTAELARGATRTLAGLSFEGAGAGFSLDMLVHGLTGRAEWVTLSVFTIPLAIAGLTDRRTRMHALFFVLAGIVLFDFLRGSAGFVYPLAYQLPLGNVFRIPARAAFAYAFAAAMAIGIGSEAVFGHLTRRPRALAIAVVALPLLVAVDSYRRGEVAVRYLPLTNPELLDAPRAVVDFAFERAQYDRLFLEKDIPSAIPYKLGQMNDVFAAPDYEPLLPGAYRDFFGLPSDRVWHGGLNMTAAYGPDVETPHVDPALLDLLSTRYYVDGRASSRVHGNDLAEAVAGKYVPDYTPPVIERESALPRAYVVHGTIDVEDAPAALDAVKRHEFDPRLAAVVENATTLPEESVPDAWEYARIVEYEPQRVELEVRCASRCLAVLTDLFYPGWQAHVDGDPVDTLRTNYLVRGVIVPSGTHRVSFAYTPLRWRAAAIVSLIATAVLLMIGLRAALTGMRPGRAEA